MKQFGMLAAALGFLGIAGLPSFAGTNTADRGWRYSDADASGPRAREPASTGMTPSSVGQVMLGEPNSGDLPANLMSMTIVAAQFGDPDQTAPAVGQPPITRWYYLKYTVYFEHDRVITSVVN